MLEGMVDSKRAPDTKAPKGVRSWEIAQRLGYVMNDVEPVVPATIRFPVAHIERDEEPISEGPPSLRPRELAPVLERMRRQAQ
jgi:hypothetical protein